MKLLRAKITNFRILRDISLEFGTDTHRNLTVVRAANESGKTTLLTALQWGLFGDVALRNRGQDVRLSPNDSSAGSDIDISVEIDFEIPTRTDRIKYRLIRYANESVRENDWTRGITDVNLIKFTDKGTISIDSPEAHIHPHLPVELRSVFFTDGDSALTFIDSDEKLQRESVGGAIRSLLGVEVIENSLKHVKSVNSDLNKKIGSSAGNQEELISVTTKIGEITDKLAELEEELKQAKDSEDNLILLEKEADQKITVALRSGNREDLENSRMEIIKNKRIADDNLDGAIKDHSNLFRSETLVRQLMEDRIKDAKIILDNMHETGRIPSQTIPVLDDCLTKHNCICGESLDESDPDGFRRRSHIKKLIEESRNSDAIQGKITELYFRASELLSPVQENTWADEFKVVFDRRRIASDDRRKYGEALSDLENKIKNLPDVDIQQLQMTRDQYRKQASEAHDEVIRLDMKIEHINKELSKYEQDREKLLQKDSKGMAIISEFQITEDIQLILSNAIETIKTSEIKMVSDRMNHLFLNMIGSNSSERSSIVRTEIDPEFRISVYGMNDNSLDPSHDLNGASRRALTIAFILALTQISEVEAPNVIDTPLGMMSGYVKQSVLYHALQQSSQLILFLTHSEINGCEDIIDERAAHVFTLTNPAHYPLILVNDPNTERSGILQCHCNHHEHCEICVRREVINIESEEE